MMLLSKNSKMATSPSFNEFKRQASFFFKEKIKSARLVLTDVTPAQLMTEEVTNGDIRSPDMRTMSVISRAAFEVDDYWRIVDILHRRLERFDRNNWRIAYKALLLLDHLLTHGPLRVAEEFQHHKDVIKDMESFRFVDDKGFNWGLSVKNLSGRVLKLLENGLFLTEERARARKLVKDIKGFGSFNQQRCASSDDLNPISGFGFMSQGRCSSSINKLYSQEDGDLSQLLDSPTKIKEEDPRHPFDDHEDKAKVSLLSNAE